MIFVDQTQVRKLGTEIQFNLDDECYDVKIAPNGDVLAATKHGLVVLDSTSGAKIKTILPAMVAGSVEVECEHIYISFREQGSRRITKFVYDFNYKKVKQWEAAVIDVTDMAVLGEKMCVSHASSNDVVVYNTQTGKKEFTIIRNSRPDGLTASQPNALIIGDSTYNTVQKYLIGRSWTIDWSAKVDKPWGLVADEGGTTWVASEDRGTITLVSRNGEAG